MFLLFLATNEARFTMYVSGLDLALDLMIKILISLIMTLRSPTSSRARSRRLLFSTTLVDVSCEDNNMLNYLANCVILFE